MSCTDAEAAFNTVITDNIVMPLTAAPEPPAGGSAVSGPQYLQRRDVREDSKVPEVGAVCVHVRVGMCVCVCIGPRSTSLLWLFAWLWLTIASRYP